MNGASRRCAGCGAEAPRPEARYCEHCGATLPEPAAPAPPPDPFGDVAARFAAFTRRPELPGLLAAPPTVPELAGRLLPSLFLLLVLATAGVFLSLLCFQMCPPLGFVPLALVVVGVVVLARQLIWTVRTPIVALPAMVVELRAKLQAGAERSPANTRHFVTLQLEDGRRVERECFPSALAGLAPGVLGVAYSKGERLAAFVPEPA